MDIDACLGIVPTAAAAVHKAASLRTTIIGILGIEDIVNLAQEAKVRSIILLAPLLHWQAVLQIQVRGRICTEHGILVLGIVEILLAHHIGLHRSCEARHIKSKE
mgnify:CR=1 FL=1